MEPRPVATVEQIMTRKLVTLRPEMTVLEAAELLLKHRISGAPVVGAEGELLGLLSEFDCLRSVASSDYEADAHDTISHVRDLMSRDPLTVPPFMDVFALAHEFVTRRVRRFPVVAEGRLVGQVSRRDALRAAVEMQQAQPGRGSRYPDYPAGRAPIRNYPGE